MKDDIRDPNQSRPTDDDPEPSFVPPEQVAADEVTIDMTETGPENPGPEATEKKPPKNKRPSKLAAKLRGIKTWFSARSKQQKIAILIGLVLGLALAGFGLYTVFGKSAPPPQPVVEKKEEVKEPPKPTTAPSRLTGVEVPIELNKLPVTGVMIENSPDARPQAGLKDAGVVFEAIAEGGITRFLALYQEAQPEYVGPVRSVRSYYLDWLKGFDAAVAHVGGSAEALQRIRNEGIKDLDQSFNPGSYQRVSSRYAPHNVYTSLASLIDLGRSKGFDSSSFTGFGRKAEAPAAAEAITARAIDIHISGPLYNVHYDYDAASNSYRRVMAGLPHTDERSGQQISPKVVIAMVIPYSIHPNGVNSQYGTIGSGKAYIFQDGVAVEGTWSKASDKDQVIFGDANGAPIGMNPGQTWITMANTPGHVSYQP